MIEIIKKGTRQVKECEVCGCVFSFNEEDIEKIDYSSQFHPKGYRKIIRCPQCERVIILEAIR